MHSFKSKAFFAFILFSVFFLAACKDSKKEAVIEDLKKERITLQNAVEKAQKNVDALQKRAKEEEERLEKLDMVL